VTNQPIPFRKPNTGSEEQEDDKPSHSSNKHTLSVLFHSSRSEKVHTPIYVPQVEELLLDVSLDGSLDQRVSFFQDDSRRLMSGLIYRASTRGDQPCPAFKFVWSNFAPPRVKFFGWLLTQDRIQCRSSLRRKNIYYCSTRRKV
jgi:hypothetical protein